jgi:exosortase/archaeosortase family protein
VLCAFYPILKEWALYTSQVSRLSYVLVVPLLCAVLTLQVVRRGPIRGNEAGRSVGYLVIASAAVLLLLGSLTGTFTLSILGLPVAVLGLVLSSGGVLALGSLAWPVLLAFLIVPPPMPIVDLVNPHLVRASGALTESILSAFDSSTSWLGNTLTFRGHVLLVPDACSGSGTLLALGTLALFVSGLFRLRPLAAGAALVFTLPFALLVNGLRIAASALVLDGFGPRYADGLGHEILGQVLVIGSATLLAWAAARVSNGSRARRGAGAAC